MGGADKAVDCIMPSVVAHFPDADLIGSCRTVLAGMPSFCSSAMRISGQ
jgi:hypothetical protein